jgi:dUTP pyrophosphatase
MAKVVSYYVSQLERFLQDRFVRFRFGESKKQVLLLWRVVMLRIEKLHPDAKIPSRKHPSDAGLDVFALHYMMIPSHQTKIIRTGITIAFEPSTVIFVWPKSRSNFLVGAGVIDCSYQGEILVKIANTSGKALHIMAKEPIAQLVITPVSMPLVEQVDCAHPIVSDRGASGGIVNNLNPRGISPK